MSERAQPVNGPWIEGEAVNCACTPCGKRCAHRQDATLRNQWRNRWRPSTDMSLQYTPRPKEMANRVVSLDIGSVKKSTGVVVCK